VETLIHEIGHIFGLRHFFANISEKEWPSEIFGTHSKFSIMNYGEHSMLTHDDRDDLRRLYELAWRGALTHINGTPIQLVRPFNTLASEASRRRASEPMRRAASRPRLAASFAAGAEFRPSGAAEAAVSVTVAASVGSGGKLSAKLNGERLTFQGGLAHASVDTGRTNTLEWIAVGPAGTTWSVKVTAPEGTGCDSSGTIDEARTAAGFCQFQT